MHRKSHEVKIRVLGKSEGDRAKKSSLFRWDWSIARFKRKSCFQLGTRAYAIQPFYRGQKVTVIGAISLTQVVALMTIDNSMDSQVFKVFIEQCLVPQLCSGAVVVMDNLPAHKVDSIKPMIEAVGASILCLSPYSPDFNPIELWWSQLKSLLIQFSPTSTKMVDRIIAVALDLINPKHLKNWFTNCCYCTS